MNYTTLGLIYTPDAFALKKGMLLNMKIIVVGLGQIGQELAKEMINEKHDVTVIDVNKNLVDNFTNKYDAIGIVGSGASKEVQEKSRCDIADVVIAVTSTDEINLMCCLTAKYLGAKYTIAKVKSLEYQNNDTFLSNKFQIDLVINSEHSTAEEITKIVGYPSNIKIERFVESRLNMAEITIRENNPLIGLSINELKETHKHKVNIACIIRKEKVIFPNSNFRFELGDIIYVLASTVNLHKFLKKIKLIDKPVKSVLMIGCGNIGKKLTRNLINMNIKVKIIEFDLKNCQELSEEFSDVTVVYGDGVDSETLIEEGIQDYDCCISLTGNDESNLVISMFAWSCQVRKIITKISSIAYTSMLHNVKIDSTVSPYSIILSSVIKYIRSIKECMDSSIKTLYRFAKNKVEAIEFEIEEEHSYSGISFGNLTIKPGVLVTYIVRDRQVITPDDSTVFENGDKVIVIVKAEIGASEIGDIFVKD